MAIDKTQLPSHASARLVPTAALPSGAKTFQSAQVYKYGVVTVIEIGFSDSSTLFIKSTHTDSSVEVGGTADLGTGTRVGF